MVLLAEFKPGSLENKASTTFSSSCLTWNIKYLWSKVCIHKRCCCGSFLVEYHVHVNACTNHQPAIYFFRYNCVKCMVIHEKHPNVLQYKESEYLAPFLIKQVHLISRRWAINTYDCLVCKIPTHWYVWHLKPMLLMLICSYSLKIGH